MTMNVSEPEEGIKLITLVGRLDILGSEQIGTRLTANIVSEEANVILDMAGVEFMASIGIGVIVGAANALLRRGGKIAMLNPQEVVYKAIESTAITKVIPCYYDMESVRSYLKS
jgi:anti-anti-sigma factor